MIARRLRAHAVTTAVVAVAFALTPGASHASHAPARDAVTATADSAARLLPPGAIPVTGHIDDPALAGLDAFVLATMRQWRVPGCAVAVVRGDRVVAVRGYGWRDAAKRLPVTPHTLMPIASCTKSFTVATLEALADEGRLDWDRPVRDELPDFRLFDEAATEQVTPRDLVTHRTGLPRHDEVWYRSGLSADEIVRRLRYLEPSRPLRTSFQYQNMMFVVAGQLASRLAGAPWREAVRQRLLVPLDMTRTAFTVYELEHAPDHATGYQRDDRDSIVVEPYQDLQEIAPAGAMVSCAEDLSHYVAMLLAGGTYAGRRVLAERDVAEMLTPQTLEPATMRWPELGFRAYGMGLDVTTYRGRVLAQHGGNMDGFSAFLSLLPREKLGVVVLTNLDQSRLREIVAYRVHDWLTHETPIDWDARLLEEEREDAAAEAAAAAEHLSPRVPGTRPSHALRDYCGSYANPAYGTIVIAPRGDSLEMTFHGTTMPLSHFHYDVFEKPHRRTDPWEELKLMFTAGWDGSIGSLQIAFEPGTHDVVFERQPDPHMTDPKFLAGLAGDYELGSTTATVTLRGHALALAIPGQPAYTLEPLHGTTFRVKELSGTTIEFRMDGPRVVAAGFYQPDGDYLAKRRPEGATGSGR